MLSPQMDAPHTLQAPLHVPSPQPALNPHPGFLCCFGASTTVVVMALGWVLFIKILLLLLALCPASIPVLGGKEGWAPGQVPLPWAPLASGKQGPQLLLHQGNGEHEAAAQHQPQPLQ